jgi:hypothetical protein
MKSSAATSLDALLDAALAPYGHKVKRLGKWLRIPAVWRGGHDYNVSISPAGTWTDFATGEKGSRQDLARLLGLDGPLPIVASANLKQQIHREQRDKARRARALWQKAPTLAASAALGTAAVLYLASRGIPAWVISEISTTVRVTTGNPEHAILLLPIYAPQPPHDLIGLQRIYLDELGHKSGEQPKRMLGLHFYGEVSGGLLLPASRKHCPEATPPLVICEGFETGLGIYAASGYPVYVAYDAGGVEHVDTHYLHQLAPRRILIAADCDDPDRQGRMRGQEAAMKLASRLRAARLACQVAIPPRDLGGKKGCDWLDVWNAAPERALALLKRPTAYKPLSFSITARPIHKRR